MRPTNDRDRRRAALLAAAVAFPVLAACSGSHSVSVGEPKPVPTDAVPATPEPSAGDAGPVKLTSAEVAADDRSVTVGFAARACQPVYEATVQQAMLSIQVYVRLGRPAGDCSKDKIAKRTTIKLDDALGGRIVVDGNSGKPLTKPKNSG